METTNPIMWLPAPATHIFSDPVLDRIAMLALCLAVAAIAFYWIKAAHLAREGIMRIVESALWAVIVWYAVAIFVLQTHPYDPAWTFLPWVAAVIAFIAKSAVVRSRYIPAAVRRAVIARDLKGEPFDPKKHHIDHIWPFVLGGSNTVDNLRVISKTDNQRKGRKRPRWHEMFNE